MSLLKFAPLGVALAAACAFIASSFISCSRKSSVVRTDHPVSGQISAFGSPRITRAFIPEGNFNRRSPKKMKPRYITIHSTQNESPGANAEAHAKLLQRAGLGNLSWHFTVDEACIYQSLPTDEQGEHADYDGPGNRLSIGIEMCENRGNCLESTMNRTASLTAWLMKKHDIPISRVVPHQHWRRVHPDGTDRGHKNCPHFLMDDGKPGKKWRAFLNRVKSYQ